MADRDPSGIPTDPQAPAIISEPLVGELAVGQVLGERYEVRAHLGEGGMGSVWRACDRELKEEIALKVIRPELLGNQSILERFRGEVKIARRIAHPNVCRVFDLGEANGLRFLTMELIEGRTLRTLLSTEGLDPLTALGILRQIAGGLAAAHEQGVIHRDLKPENIIVCHNGRAIVADFGLARSQRVEHMTAAGPVGTPAYMSPEQLRGEPLDLRSDIFSLGIVAYKLFTRRSPFGDGSPATITSAILRDPPHPLEIPGLSPDLVATLEQILERAMAKRPEDRFPSARSFEDALAAVEDELRRADITLVDRPTMGSGPQGTALSGRWEPRKRRISTVSAMLLLLVAVVLVWRYAVSLRGGALAVTDQSPLPPSNGKEPVAGASAPEDGRPRAIVVPFENLTSEAVWDGLAGGATEAVRAGLRTMPEIRLLDSPRVGEPEAEAKRRGATWLVTGSIQRVGQELRLAAQIRATDGSAAGEPVEIDGDPASIPRSLEALRSRILDEARLVWRDHDRHERAVRGTKSDEARNKLLQYYTMVGPGPRFQHLEGGELLLNGALAADAAYVPALVERAYLRALQAGARREPARHKDALFDLDTALSHKPDDASVLVMRCRILQVALEAGEHIRDAEVANTVSACNTALQAAPTSAHVFIALARLHDRRCRDELAIDALEQALELDRGMAGWILAHLVTLALNNGRMEVAERMSQRLVEFEDEEHRLGARSFSQRSGVPQSNRAHLLRAAVLLRLHRLDPARAELEQQLAIFSSGMVDRWSESASIRGLLHIAQEKKEPAPPRLKQRLAELEGQYLAASDPKLLHRVARAYQWSDPEAAAAWLERLGEPESFEDGFTRALVYTTIGNHTAARRMLEAREPSEQWQRDCKSSFLSRLHQ